MRTNRAEVLEYAKRYGLYVATYSPGDGTTRYRVFRKESLFDESGSLFTAIGIRELEVFVKGVRAGLAT